MKNEILQCRNEALDCVVNDQAEVETFRIKYLGKKGILNDFFARFKDVPNEEKKEVGQLINELKQTITAKLEEFQQQFSASKSDATIDDMTRPAGFGFQGSRHPLAIVKNRMVTIFEKMGFSVEEGPEIEDDWHNFSALNFPPEHPARDMQDTFFIDTNPDIALRTHTSSVQVRVMENTKPPIRSIFPGRVYRNEAISARAHCFFHQIEGLYVDKNVTFADLKQALLHFSREMFDPSTEIRLRPSYFPFTEPSAEMDISCNLCGGEGCAFCKYTGWVEILGCGMVDPNVLKNCGIDPEVYTGYAFGIGIERITNLIYGVKDLRMFSENDVRFLSQFRGAQ